MSYQIHDYGRSCAELLKNGQSSSRGDIPLGAYHDDGDKRYRWAYCRFAATGTTPGQVVTAQSVFASGTKLSGSHFTSAVEQYGAAGARTIKLRNASCLASSMRYQNGTFEIHSGTGAPFMCDIESVEAGTQNGYNLIALEGELPKALSTDMAGVVRPNRWFGCKFAPAHVSANYPFRPAGACTASAITSGYQLLQTRGLGIGYMSSDLTSGKIIGVGECSGQLMTGTMGGISASLGIGHLIGGMGDTATSFFTVEWFIE